MSKKLQGIIFIILSAFCFAWMSAFVRLAGDLPSIQKSFFRNFVALIFSTIVLLRSKEKFRFNTKNLPDLFCRAFFGTIGLLCNFYAVDHLMLADASILNKLSPFFAVVFSFFLLKERIRPYQLAAVVIAFIGSLFVIKPSASALSQTIPSLVGFAGGMGAGIAYTFVRKLSSQGERGAFIVFFFSAFSCLVTLPYILFFYQPMQLCQLGYLLMAGLAAAGGQFTITAAYSRAPAREISVFDYTQIIFSSSLGFFLFGQVPDVWSVFGYVVICGVSVWMAMMNLKKSHV